MTDEERQKWRKATDEAMLKALKQASGAEYQRCLKEPSEAEALKTTPSAASPAKPQSLSESSQNTEQNPHAELTSPDNPSRIESLIRIQPPSENVLRINRALLENPPKPPTIEQARKQVQEHLRQAAEEISRHGRERQID